MDYNTEQLIEKYKSQMQEMIETKEKTKDNRDVNLKEKIEEILRQNSEVVTPDDYPTENAIEQTMETETTQEPSENPQEIQVQLAASQNNNTPAQQEMVSRTCIRGGQKAQYSPPANTGSSLNVNETSSQPLMDSGYLKIEAFSANRAFPVNNAVVRVKNAENNSLIGVFVTNQDGLTEFFKLAAPDRKLSQSAVTQTPFSNYLVDVRAQGYAPVDNVNVQMFGGIESVLPVNLIPQIKR